MIRKPGKVLRAVRPNLGIQAAYRKRLLALVDEMVDSYRHWIVAAYRQNEPKMAEDALPAKALQRALTKLRKQWKERFAESSEKLAAYFAKTASRRSERQLQKILRDGGWSVRFRMTPAQRDVLTATVQENVSLIRSIPEEFATQIEGIVMRSVTAGRDLSQLTKDLEKRFDVSRRRASLIARDQNNKATAMLTRARYRELGISEAIWLHSAGGKKPRPTHVKNSGKRYDVVKGWYDPAVKRWIHPGELINCRCVSRPVVKGFS